MIILQTTETLRDNREENYLFKGYLTSDGMSKKKKRKSTNETSLFTSPFPIDTSNGNPRSTSVSTLQIFPADG